MEAGDDLTGTDITPLTGAEERKGGAGQRLTSSVFLLRLLLRLVLRTLELGFSVALAQPPLTLF